MEETSIWELFNWIDLVLVVGLTATVFIGLGLGFFRQLAILLSLAIGLIVASEATAPLARASFFSPLHARLGQSGAEAVAFIGIVLVTLLVGLGVLLTFRRFFGRALRAFDSVLGGALGLAMGALGFGIVCLALFQWEDSRLHDPIRGSFLGSKLAEGTQLAAQIFPEEFRDRVEANLKKRNPFAESPAPPPETPPSETPPPIRPAGSVQNPTPSSG